MEDLESSWIFERDRFADDDKAYDSICEIADSHIPIYTYQVLEVAMSDLWLVYDSPAMYSSNCQSPLQLIQANIYEHLQSKLFERYNKNKIE